jgi:hypothetical protein
VKRLNGVDVMLLYSETPEIQTHTLPMNIPLPSKIVHRVLEPIDIAATFGDDPDVGEVDAHIRACMQDALDALADERRLPVIG